MRETGFGKSDVGDFELREMEEKKGIRKKTYTGHVYMQKWFLLNKEFICIIN